MAIDFPDSPSVNDTFEVNGRTYTWNGTQWKRVDAEVASVSPSLTVTGDFTVGTDTLAVDSTNDRVGIGTVSPSVELDVAGTATVSGNVSADHINVGSGVGLGDSGEDIRAGGIRGTFTSANAGSSELIHLFNNVNIGYPTGWGGQDAPQYGLSVYGAIDSGNPIIAGQMGSAMSSPSSDTILLFNEFWVNQGGIGYSAGVFTVPIAGVYRITLNPFMNYLSGDFRVLIGVNNSAPSTATHYGHCYCRAHSLNGNGMYDTLCLDSVVSLSANDNIRFRLYSGQLYNSSSDRFNQFSIAKIA